MKRAIIKTKVKTAVIAGGVASNLCLRNKLKENIKDVKLIYPDITYCNDNAAMIAYLGEKKAKIIKKNNLNFSAIPNLKL